MGVGSLNQIPMPAVPLMKATMESGTMLFPCACVRGCVVAVVSYLMLAARHWFLGKWGCDGKLTKYEWSASDTFGMTKVARVDPIWM